MKSERSQHNIHRESSSLLVVPRCSDVLDGTEDIGDADNARGNSIASSIVNSAAGWRKELAKWKGDQRANDGDSESEGDEASPDQNSRRREKAWLPRSLALLFAGSQRPLERRPRARFDEETRLMELLAAEHDDEALDDGALEGSGDEYEP